MKFPRMIYSITHNPTGRTYVGSSKDAQARIKSHLYALRRGTHPVQDMQADFDTYGEDYTFLELEQINSWEERRKEYDWMVRLESNVKGKGYNYKDKAVRSTARNKTVWFEGNNVSIAALAEQMGVPYDLLYGRVHRGVAQELWFVPARHSALKGRPVQKKKGGCA